MAGHIADMMLGGAIVIARLVWLENGERSATAPTLPLAICRAALAAVQS